MRTRVVLVVVGVTVLPLAACGDSGTGSLGDETVAPTSVDAVPTTDVASTATGTSTEASTDTSTGTSTGTSTPDPGEGADASSTTEVPPTTVAAQPVATDPVVATPAALARCSDVAPIETDVLSDPARGDIDPVFHGVLLTYAAEHADTFGGLWLDRNAFGTVVMAFTDDPGSHRAALAARRPSPDDVYAIDPPPEITDDRPIGEWDVAFDVVQVEHTEAALNDAIGPVMEAAQVITGDSISGGSALLLNRVTVDLSAPVSAAELTALEDAIADLDGVGVDMVCWSGELVDEAPEPVEPGSPLDAIRLPGEDGTYPPDTPVSCSEFRFELGDLQNLTPIADLEPGLRSVVDSWLAGPAGQSWPQAGWTLLSSDSDLAFFIQIDGEAVSSVVAEMGPNGWIWAGATLSFRCDVRLLLPDGVGEVEWVLDPDAPPPDASSTQLRLLATERSCASGQEMGERLLGPQVVETDDAVLIALGVIPQPGAQACPGNPSTPVVVDLAAPLGDRAIRDAMSLGPITSLIDP
jgi:hypothetical protein